MNTIYTYSIPSELWNRVPRVSGNLDVLQDLIQDVLVTRRRLRKSVDEATQSTRCHTACDLLEQALANHVARNAAAFPRLVNDPQYGEMLFAAWGESQLNDADDATGVNAEELAQEQATDAAPKDYIGPTIFAPGDVPRHIDAMIDRLGEPAEGSWLAERIEFLRSEVVARRARGAIEIREELPHPASLLIHSRNEGLAQVQSEDEDSEFSREPRRLPVHEILRNRITTAMQSGEPVNMNNQNHVIITEVLNEFVNVRVGLEPANIRVVYGDGSYARDFPLLCLPDIEPVANEQIVPVALMSMRHLLLDEHVVQNWLRNAEIDQSSTLARSDEYCYLRTVEELAALRQGTTAERVCVHLFHTGYEPAVVGVYRAAVESIRDHGDWLRIIPHFFGDSGFLVGESWPRFKQEIE